MLELHGQAMGGELVLPKPLLESRKHYLVSMEGKRVVETLKAERKSKSDKQLGAHFGLLINTVIAKANDEGLDTSEFLKLLVREDLPTGVGLTKDFLNELFYAVCPTYDDEGRRITLSNMTTAQAADWFDRLRNLLASRGIYIPDPDPNWKDKDNG